jgi:HAD superfamily hydrolase (TIGR01484 family)
MGPAEEIAKIYKALMDHYEYDLHIYKSKDTYLEIANKKISKKSAIQTLLDIEFPELDWKQVIAFGDNYNDMEMLDAVGMGVAVGNAKPEVLAMADYITNTNTEDGVAIAMKTIVK